MNHFLLHLFVRSIGPSITGRRIGTVRYLAPVLSIELTGDATPRYLAAILANPGPYIYLSENDPLPGVGNDVFKRVRGLPVNACEQAGDDRVIRLDLGSGREQVDLVLRLFGSSGRARILGSDSIIESLDPREAGRPRPSPSKPRSPSLAVVDAHILTGALSADTGESLDRSVPGLTRELLECFASDASSASAKSTADGDVSIDVPKLLSWRDELIEGGCRFHLGTRGSRAGAVGPLPDPAPADLKLRLGPFNRADVACKRAGESILATILNDMVTQYAAPLKKRLDSRRRLAVELAHDLETAESFEVWRKEANVLAAFQSKIPPGSSGVVLPDPYESENEITIKLDPALSISDQIEKRFKRAAKLERSRDTIEQRIQTIQADIELLENELAAVARQTTLGDAVRCIDKAVKHYKLEPRSQTQSRVTRGVKTYRRFELDSLWFALVGRNNKENDEITFRVAAPDDIWLHADQVPGSHVILKSHGAPGNPPATILEAAAAIAAYFSKARHASLVPVIYTRRKYVRKFRGARAGQVTCEREKTVMAEPALPDNP